MLKRVAFNVVFKKYHCYAKNVLEQPNTLT